MNDVNSTRLSDLSHTLMGVKDRLADRALDRTRGEVEAAYDFINSAADAGAIEIGCDGDEVDSVNDIDGDIGDEDDTSMSTEEPVDTDIE